MPAGFSDEIHFRLLTERKNSDNIEWIFLEINIGKKWQINTNTVSDSIKSWKIVSPRFLEKAFRREFITRKQNN